MRLFISGVPSYLSLYDSTALVDLGRFFSFLIMYTVDRTPWMGDQSVARLLPTHRTIQTQNKRTQTHMPQVEFESTIPVFERAKIVHAVDRAATVIGISGIWLTDFGVYPNTIFFLING
jgi:hypothetical protein